MSEERSDAPSDEPPQPRESMTDRLASLRSSIQQSRRDAPPSDDEADDLDDFVADDTQISLSSDDLPLAEIDKITQFEETEEMAPRFDAGTSSDFLAQMDQASEVAEHAAPDDDGPDEFSAEPTVIQSLDELAFVQGTPLYMSPEQCRNEPAGPPTDVYSLGVLMFELFEGFPPYIAETADEVILKHQDAPIPTQRARFTPDDVRDLVTRMLAKNPEDRPSTAEVVEVLQSHVAVVGPDLHGLEEESWSVTNVAPSAPAAAPIGMALATGQEATLDLDKSTKMPPVWVVVLFGLFLLVSAAAAFALRDRGEPPVPVPLEPAAVVDVPFDELNEPEAVDEMEGMEFDVEAEAAVADIAPRADAGHEIDAGAPDVGPAEAPVVEEEPPKVVPKKKKRKRKRKPKPKPQPEELRELRLDL